jgi:hypothetical protein
MVSEYVRRDWVKRSHRSDRQGHARSPPEGPGGSVEDWATELLLAAQEAYQESATGQRIRVGAKLGDAYDERSLPVARRRLYEAGVRLAMVLDEVFSES